MRGFQNIDSVLNETYEYAFSAVPMEKRKNTSQLILILIGFAFSSSGFNIGAQIGQAMPFSTAAIICLAGNTVLFLIGFFWGMEGYKTGYASVFLVKKTLGDKVAVIFAALVVIAMIVWIGVNGKLLAKILITLIPKWPFHISMTAIIVMACGICCAIMGWKGLERISKICVPLILILTVYNLIQLGMLKGGFGFVLFHHPMNFPVPAGMTVIIGNFLMSAATIPDLCRFAKSRRAVLSCVAAYASILTVSNLCGILIVQATGAKSLFYGIFLLGIEISAFLWVALCAYTTQNLNLYTGSLAIQNLVRDTVMGGNISYRVSVLLIGSLAIIVSVIGNMDSMSKITMTVVLIIMPLVGVLLTELLTGKKESKRKERNAFIAWTAGIAAGCIIWLLCGMVVWSISLVSSGCIYALLRKGSGDITSNLSTDNG